MKERRVAVENSRGIHLRPSGIIAQALRGYTGTARVVTPDGTVNTITASPLSVMALSLAKDAVVTVQVEGPDEEKMLDTLCTLFAQKYEFGK